MERPYQNSARDWVLHTYFKPKSIKFRLLCAIGVLLFAVWLSAAVFTKLRAFDESRLFLKDVARADAEMMLNLVTKQNVQLDLDSSLETRRVLHWDRGIQVQSADDPVVVALSEYQEQDLDTVVKIKQDNWVISSRCSGIDCVLVAIRDTERKFAIRRLVAVIFLPLLALFALTLLALYGAVKFGLRPLEVLTKDVRNLDLNRLEKLPGREHVDELHPLASAIDGLTDKMREGLRDERALLDVYAHEIRTPVAGVVSQVQALQDLQTEHLPEAVKQQLALITYSARRTVRITDQFLGLAKTNSVFADLKGAKSFDLSEIIRLVLADLITLHPNSTIEFAGATSIQSYGDPFAVELIIQNLIENAIKHSRNIGKTKILVTCTEDAEFTEIRIEDDGPGVASCDHSHIKDRFIRLKDGPPVSPSVPSGTGLGLSIVNEVVRSWGGTLEFDRSETLGGLAVIVRLANRRLSDS